jgi:hypothetical protein
MIHFDAKHQKSEVKTKVKYSKIKQKNQIETKISEKIDKNVFFSPKTKLGSKIMQKILNFASFEAKKFSPSFRFKAKITKSKRSEKFKAKKAKKSEKIDLNFASLRFA